MAKQNKNKNSLYSKLRKLFSRVDKRQRFILSTLLLAGIYVIATHYGFETIPIFIPIIVLSVYVLTFFSILDGITRFEWIILFIHPIYFAIVFYLFYFFVPQRWLTRLPFVILYSISTYALLLSQNIFNVGANKSLQLFRAAFSVNYLFTTVSSFLAFSLILSLRLNPLFNMLLIFLSSLPLVLHLLWSVEPKDVLDMRLLRQSLLISFLIGETGLILSFMPINQAIFALVCTSLLYGLSGLQQTYLQGTFFKQRIREYLFVIFFAIILIFLTVQWS